MKTAAWIGILALATAGVAACGDDESTTPGTTTATTGTATTTSSSGAGGTGGATTSSSSGAGGTGGDGVGGAGGGVGGAGGAGGSSGLLPFGSPCTAPAECESGICNPQQGAMFCTVMCQVDGDCPPPMDCNNNNFCKI
jgi:hypothetical protein